MWCFVEKGVNIVIIIIIFFEEWLIIKLGIIFEKFFMRLYYY